MNIERAEPEHTYFIIDDARLTPIEILESENTSGMEEFHKIKNSRTGSIVYYYKKDIFYSGNYDKCEILSRLHYRMDTERTAYNNFMDDYTKSVRCVFEDLDNE